MTHIALHTQADPQTRRVTHHQDYRQLFRPNTLLIMSRNFPARISSVSIASTLLLHIIVIVVLSSEPAFELSDGNFLTFPTSNRRTLFAEAGVMSMSIEKMKDKMKKEKDKKGKGKCVPEIVAIKKTRVVPVAVPVRPSAPPYPAPSYPPEPAAYPDPEPTAPPAPPAPKMEYTPSYPAAMTDAYAPPAGYSTEEGDDGYDEDSDEGYAEQEEAYGVEGQVNEGYETTVEDDGYESEGYERRNEESDFGGQQNRDQSRWNEPVASDDQGMMTGTLFPETFSNDHSNQGKRFKKTKQRQHQHRERKESSRSKRRFRRQTLHSLSDDRSRWSISGSLLMFRNDLR